MLNFPTLKELIEETHKFSIPKNDSYIKTYPEFIKYFEQINTIEEHHLVISSHFVYGWMPTIITLNLTQKYQVLVLLNDIKNGKTVISKELEILKTAINNSLVGLSKLLHFINPREYAIWDSRIFRYLTGKKSTYGVDKILLYVQYLEFIKELSNDTDYNKFHSLISRHFNYPIYPTRAIEIVMFESHKRLHTNIGKENS